MNGKLALFSIGTSIALILLLVDMCGQLGGWRIVEPFALVVVVIVCSAIGSVVSDLEKK